VRCVKCKLRRTLHPYLSPFLFKDARWHCSRAGLTCGIASTAPEVVPPRLEFIEFVDPQNYSVSFSDWQERCIKVGGLTPIGRPRLVMLERLPGEGPMNCLVRSLDASRVDYFWDLRRLHRTFIGGLGDDASSPLPLSSPPRDPPAKRAHSGNAGLGGRRSKRGYVAPPARMNL